MGEREHQMPSPEQLKEIMTMVTDKVPGLLERIAGIITDNYQGVKMGSSVATFYSALSDRGMSQNQAFGPPRPHPISDLRTRKNSSLACLSIQGVCPHLRSSMNRKFGRSSERGSMTPSYG